MTPLFDEIRPADIEAWGKTHEAAQWMPSLMLQLIGASGARIKSCRFLTHEETTTGGLDGLVETQAAGLNVPAGLSAWELSKQANSKGKAAKDAAKAVILEAVPANTTHVTVSLRIWPKKKVPGAKKGKAQYLPPAAGKQADAKALVQKGGWKDAAIIDAVDLASALAQAPGVAIWLASVMGRKVKGANSLKRHFDDLASLSAAGLPPSVFLAGREQFVTALDSFLSGSPGSLPIYCTSSDDLRDAVAAWWTDNAGKSSTVHAAIAVQSNEAWEWLRHASQPMLLYLEDSVEAAPEQVSAAIKRGHYVVLRAPVVLTGQPCFLPLLPRDALFTALQKAGFDHTKAWKHASAADGSGVVLKQLLGGNASQPAWAKGAGAAKLAPVVLLGAWDEALTGDKESVAAVFGKPYAKVTPTLAAHIEVNHPLLRRNRDQWRIVSREDTWRWLAPQLDSATCARFVEAAKSALTEVDPQYAVKAEDRLLAELRGLKNSRSALLKVGIAEALCLFALQPPASMKSRGTALARHVVAESLPQPGQRQHWASLRGALPLMAEAAPDETLKAIEMDLLDPKPGTAALLGEGSYGLIGHHLCFNLMQALQGLLWEPEWIARAVDALVALAARDPGGNTSPRPLSVLESAFLPALPQCCLNAAERGILLDGIFERTPEVGWQLGLKLLPKGMAYASMAHRPRFRPVAMTPPRPSFDDYWGAVRHVIKLLVAAAGADVSRWEPLIRSMHNFPEDVFDLTLEEIRKLGAKVDPAAKARLWEAMHHEVNRHRTYSKMNWAMPPARLAKAAAVLTSLEPTDPVLAAKWLFDQHSMDLPETDLETPHEQQKKRHDDARRDAVKKVVDAEGIPGALRLAGLVKYAGDVGDLCVSNKFLIDDATILPSKLESTEAGAADFAYGYARARFLAGGWAWFESLNPQQWNPATVAKLSPMFPFDADTWNRFVAMGAAFNEAYWRRVYPWCQDLGPAEVETAIENFLKVGRPDSALDCISSAKSAKVAVSAKVALATLQASRESLAARADNEEPLPVHHGYRFGELIQLLHQAKGLTPGQLQSLQELEWFFLPVLESSYVPPQALTERLRKEPAAYVQFVSMMYAPDKSVEQKMVTEPTKAERKQAHNAYDLIGSIRELPGANGGTLNEAAFLAWVAEVRKIAAERDYAGSIEYELGKLMILAPTDPAGFWPCAPVAKLLSEPGREDMRRNFTVTLFNNQGKIGSVVNPFGGDPRKERREAIKWLRTEAGKLNLKFPLVAGCLREVADDQERFLTEFIEKD